MTEQSKLESKRFPEEFLGAVREAVRLEEVVGTSVSLTRRGSNYLGLCPFHDEKTPSFHVSATKQLYHCFGCKKGGDVFSFIMQRDALPFPKAVAFLAETHGIPIPHDGSSPLLDNEVLRSRVIEMNTEARDFWHAAAARDEAIKSYLAERGIGQDAVDRFQLGVADDSWDSLKNYISQKGFTSEQMAAGGLFSKNQSGSLFDRFRSRLMVPIQDEVGRVVAFGGRDLGGKDKAKYINSPETEFYTKGDHLYGLFQAKSEISRRGFAVVTEGYFDVITLHSAGVGNAVAVLGTALTEQQASMLRRFTDKVVICFDGDSAGIANAEKAALRLMNNDISVKVLVLPNGADPDEFVRANGVAVFERLRGKALNWTEFMMHRAVMRRDLSDPKEKARAVSEALDSLRKVEDELERRGYFVRLMEKLDIAEEFHAKLWKKMTVKSSTAEVTELQTATGTMAKTELIQLLVGLWDQRVQLISSIESELTERSDIKNIIEHLKACANQSDLARGEGLSDTEVVMLRECIIGADEMVGRVKSPETYAHQCVASIRRDELMQRLREVSGLILSIDFSADGWRDSLDSLSRQKNELVSTLGELGV